MAKKDAVNRKKAVLDILATRPNALPQEVASMLAAKGIEVGAPYVSNIKWELSRAGGVATKAAAPAQKAAPVVKVAKPATPASVASATPVESSPVTAPAPKKVVRKKKVARKVPVQRPAVTRSAPEASSDLVSVRVLVQAKALVDELGGIEKARAVLSALARLTEQ